MTISYNEHQAQSRAIAARCAVVTLSDTRTLVSDGSGRRICELLESEGHSIARRELIPDDPGRLQQLLATLLADAKNDVILTNGGTGISQRDATISVVEKMIARPLPGFGELFRMLSWEQIGSGAMLSRAAAGVADNRLIFAMPGSTAAVELAMTRLVLPELRHLLHELRK